MKQLKLIDNIININKPLLSVKELLNSVNYQYNSLFLDQFWNNIKDDIWIYIDDNMLKYIGYSRIEYKKNKQDYLNILKDNFECGADYKLLFSKEFDEFSKCHKLALSNSVINEHNKVKHLIVSPDCFKQSLMLLKTNKSKEIKKYYIELEKVFKFYLEYQNEYQKLQLENHKNELENKNQELEEKEKIINEQKQELNTFINIQQKTVKLLEKDSYVYIATNKLNSKNNVFKIGKTLTLNGRLSNFNINALLDNEFYYTFISKCYNSKMLECLLHNFLQPFHYKNELFQLHYKPLYSIVKEICLQYDIMTNTVNDYIKNNYINDLSLNPIIPAKFNHLDFNINNDNLINIIHNNEVEDNELDNQNLEVNNILTEEDVDTIKIESNIGKYNNINIFICPRNCEFACKERTTMLNHISRVNKCIKLFQENKELTQEYLEYLIQKNEIKFYNCDICNKYFPTPSKLNRHLFSQESCKNEYKCDKCDRKFRLRGDYDVHIKNINCLDENGNIIRENNIINNPTVQVENPNKININGIDFYKCHLCSKLFKCKQNLTSHLNKKMKCNILHKCHKCNRIFHSYENLKKHENQRVNCINQIFKCDKCNKLFSTHRNLKKHLKLINCKC